MARGDGKHAPQLVATSTRSSSLKDGEDKEGSQYPLRLLGTKLVEPFAQFWIVGGEDGDGE
jgi:hypothetical protein